jgi:hypothetical protein
MRRILLFVCSLSVVLVMIVGCTASVTPQEMVAEDLTHLSERVQSGLDKIPPQLRPAAQYRGLYDLVAYLNEAVNATENGDVARTVSALKTVSDLASSNSIQEAVLSLKNYLKNQWNNFNDAVGDAAEAYGCAWGCQYATDYYDCLWRCCVQHM